MPKNKKNRWVNIPPAVYYFKPAGVPVNRLMEIVLSLEEYEAIRLSDYDGLKHDEAAVRMGVSRPTFTRVLAEARQKLADAVINGKAIIIDGGNYVFINKLYICRSCGFTWDKKLSDEEDSKCPNCGSPTIELCNNNFCRGKGRGFGRGKRKAMTGHGRKNR